MHESFLQRTGNNPITGDPLGGQALVNKINGNEWTIPKHDDLQYACIFPLVKVGADGSITASCRTSTSFRRIWMMSPITSPSGISPPKFEVTTVSPV